VTRTSFVVPTTIWSEKTSKLRLFMVDLSIAGPPDDQVVLVQALSFEPCILLYSLPERNPTRHLSLGNGWQKEGIGKVNEAGQSRFKPPLPTRMELKFSQQTILDLFPKKTIVPAIHLAVPSLNEPLPHASAATTESDEPGK
jgi:hypothetical protein